MSPRQLCFVDLETTGLDPGRHAIIEVGFVLTESEGGELTTFEAKVLPPEGVEVATSAVKVNGYDRARWIEEKAVPLCRIWGHLTNAVEGRIYGGHNAPFDLGFLDAAAKNFGDEIEIDRAHIIDTKLLLMPMWIEGMIESTSLAKVTGPLGIVHDRPHSALSDALASAAIYRICRRGLTKKS